MFRGDTRRFHDRDILGLANKRGESGVPSRLLCQFAVRHPIRVLDCPRSGFPASNENRPFNLAGKVVGASRASRSTKLLKIGGFRIKKRVSMQTEEIQSNKRKTAP